MAIVYADGFDQYNGAGPVKIDGKVVGFIDEVSWGNDLRLSPDSEIKSIRVGDQEITGTCELNLESMEQLESLMGGYSHNNVMDIETDSFTWDGPTTTIVHNSRRDERYGNMNRAQRRKVIAQERRAMRKFK